MTNIRDRHRPDWDIRRERMRMRRHHHGGDKRWFGVILLIIGTIIMLRKFDLLYFDFHTMWPWIVIAVGTMIGVKSRFRNNAWWILVLIGTANLIPVFTIWGVSSKALLIPATMIALGILLIFRPQRKKNPWDKRCDNNIKTVTSDDNILNIDVTFGGHKEVVTSKDFKGGTVSATFGGAEINLMNAKSMDQKVSLNLKVTFGGVELVVPSDWEIRNEMHNTLGNVEDNRQVFTQSDNIEDRTVLYLTGNCSFGAIEIKSY